MGKQHNGIPARKCTTVLDALARPASPQNSLPFMPGAGGGLGLKVDKHITLIQRGYNHRSASCLCWLLWLAL